MGFKKLIRNHWFSIAVILIAIGLSVISVCYAWNLSKKTKDIEEKRAIYQLAITAIAASVGIGTIINSTRSASIAAESIQLTRDKEIRGQSSRLIGSVSLNQFKISPPTYNDEFYYHPLETFRNHQKSNNSKTKSYEQLTQETLEFIESKSKMHVNSINYFRLLNIGEGASLNIEYSFEFVNKDKFEAFDLYLNNRKKSHIYDHKFPSYDISVLKSNNSFSIKVNDNLLSSYIKNFNNNNNYNLLVSQDIASFKNSEVIQYIDFLKPNEEIMLPIPYEFVILSKQYIISSYYTKMNNDGLIPDIFLPGISHLIYGKKIKPLGKVRVLYNDEAITKSNKKKELYFNLSLKEESILKQDDELNFYLEVTPAQKNDIKLKTAK